ncbi:MAG: ABC transporter ATP-binding protein [bacterium]
MQERRKIRHKKVWRMIAFPLKRNWRYFPVFFAFAFVLSMLTIAEPYIYGTIIDSIISSVGAKAPVGVGINLIFPLLVAWALVALFQSIFNALNFYTVFLYGNKVLGEFTRELFRRMLRMDIEIFYKEHAGGIMRRFDSAWDAIWRINNIVTRDIFSAGSIFIVALTAGFIVDWRLMLIALIPIPAVVAIGMFNYFNTAPHQHNIYKFWEMMFDHAGDFISNIATVKSYSSEQRGVSKYSRVFKKAYSSQKEVNKKWAAGEAGYGGVYIAGRLLIFIIGAYWVLNGSLSIGTLIMFLGFATYVSGAVQQLMHALPDFSDSLVKMDRAADYWYNIPNIQESPGAKVLRRINGKIEVKNLTFAYPSVNKPALNNISIDVPAGKTVAFVGESGAGKSTFAQLMMRFYDPQAGSITIDGIDLRDIKLASLEKNIGFVMQENLLFHDTVLGNIRFAKPSAGERAIIAAAKRAQAHDFIKNLPNGYKTIVGERGIKLSGGQKQRIALARVLLEDPPILVLDEATSALDSKTERELQSALLEVMKDRTTIVIAHRLSTVMAADNIIVLDKGRIVDQGKHEDLIRRGGLYKQYWQIQAGGYV